MSKKSFCGGGPPTATTTIQKILHYILMMKVLIQQENANVEKKIMLCKCMQIRKEEQQLQNDYSTEEDYLTGP